MAVEIIGDPKDVKRYREYLHRQGVLTKRFMSALQNQGYQFQKKPEGYRIFNGGIKSVYVNKDGAKIKRLDPEDRLYIAGVANANMVDRVDERLEPAGIDIEHFLKNSVLLLDHLYVTSQVIGKVSSLRPESDGVHFEGYIGDPHKAPLTQAQMDTRSLVAQRLVQTVSVGFIPHKIQAPSFDGEGRLVEPAVILNWELLELSVVAIPCNAGAVFDLKDTLNDTESSDSKGLTSSETTVKIDMRTDSRGDNKSEFEILNPQTKQEDQRESTEVQTLIFDKEKFSRQEAIDWAKEHEFRADKVDETEDSYRLRQKNPDEFDPDSFRTIDITDGVKAVIGRLKSLDEESRIMEEKIVELLDEMKRLNSSMLSFGDTLKEIKNQGEAIRGILDSDKRNKPKEDEKPYDEEKPKEDEEDKEKSFKEEIEELKTAISKQNDNIEKISEVMLSILDEHSSRAGG